MTLKCLSILTGIILFGSITTLGQGVQPSGFRLQNSPAGEIQVVFENPGFDLQSDQDAGKAIFRIFSEQGHSLLRKGCPDVPVFSQSIIIPGQGNTRVEVVSSEYRDYPGVSLVPSKGNLTRDVDPSAIPYTYGPVYLKDNFFPGSLVEGQSPYVFRDFRGQSFQVQPFQYNPVSKLLRVYEKIVFRVKMDPNGAGINELPLGMPARASDSEFSNVYARHFLNYSPVKYTPVGETGEMVIISHGPFISALQPFVQWKQQKGIHVTVVDVAVIGNNSTAIKNYVSNLYNNKPFAFLLLVGDAAQVATVSSSAGDSDPSYGYITGNDHYPEILVGRFSAETFAQVQVQVQKVLNYEKNATTADGFYAASLGIASSQGPGDDNQYDYQHIRGLQDQLDAYTYDGRAECFDGSQGGVDAAGNPAAATVAEPINAGVGAIVYCGHGSDASWGTSGFSSTNVNALTNTNKLPFIFSVACVNGNFVTGTCFAESWMRAATNGTPKGAIATLMSTINQSWNPPMEGQDEMIAVLTESYSTNIKRTFGGVALNGISKMNDSYAGTAGTDMADTWTLFGDPSVVLRTDTPKVVNVSHAPTIFIGGTEFLVNCSSNGANVCISLNDQILSVGTVSNGQCLLGFDPLANIDTLVITITGYNLVTYQGLVPIVPNDGPYLVLNGVSSFMTNGSPASLFTSGLLGLQIDLKNVGVLLSPGASASISSTDPYVQIQTGTLVYGDILPSMVVSNPLHYMVQVASNIPDQHAIPFQLLVNDSQANSWTIPFTLVAIAPNPRIQFHVLNDPAGNGNHRLDPGEAAEMVLKCFNQGNFPAMNATAVLSSTSPWVTISNGSAPLGTMVVNDTLSPTFGVVVSPDVPVGTQIPFVATIQSGDYHFEYPFFLKAGLIVEDWETSNFDQFEWQNSGSYPWVITQSDAFEGVSAARSADISDSQSSTLIIQIDVAQADTVSFFRKISSEQDWDFLRFYIDNVLQQEWSGEIGWEKVGFPITAGTHSLKWVYVKDGYYSNGQDLAWIDFVVFPPLNVNSLPVFESSPALEALVGQAYEYQIVTSDADADALSLQAVSVPAWLSFVSGTNGTGTLSGTPGNQEVGDWPVVLRVNDGVGVPVEQTFVVQVLDPNSLAPAGLSPLRIIPNPAGSQARIMGNLPANTSLRILDPLSRQVVLNFDHGFDGNLDVSKLKPGLYFVEIRTDGNVQVLRLIRQ